MTLAIRRALARVRLALLVSLIVGPGYAVSAAADQDTKRVFVLNSFNRGYTWTDNTLRGVDDAFGTSGLRVDSYVTFMDLKRIHPTPQYFSQLKELIAVGYRGVRFDAVLACDNDALQFIRQYRDELFPGLPVVFSSINDFEEDMLDGRRDITGTAENTDYGGTIRLALTIRPGTKRIVVVTDSTTTGMAHRSAVEKIRPTFPPDLDFMYISLADMTLNELGDRLSRLGNDSVVLLLQHFVDKTGTAYTVQQTTPLLTARASVPVFVVTDIRVGLGALGGHVVSGYQHGWTAAQMVTKILGGSDISSIPVLLDSPNKYMFDYQVMRRFRVAERNVPRESTLINKPVSALEKYRKEILAALGLFVALCGVLVYLMLEIRRRKRTEAQRMAAEVQLRALAQELKEKNQEMEEMLYAASHDLRSPLLNVQGFSSILAAACEQVRERLRREDVPDNVRADLEPTLAEEVPSNLRFIGTGVLRLDALISGLLAVSRAGRQEMHPEGVNMVGLMTRVQAAMAFQLQEAGASVAVGALPPCVGDVSALIRVFTNLLDNALKYRHPDRAPRLHVSGRVEAGHCIYCVEDNGIGIDPRHHADIWRLFYRLDPSGPAKGEGLGLTLVHRVLNRMRGRAWVESKSGVGMDSGCRFFVELPACMAEDT